MSAASSPVASKISLLAGTIYGFTAVLLGAFGAHGLEELLAERGSTATWETAVRYQMWHALALLFVSLGTLSNAGPAFAARTCFIAGIPFFSGSLYLLALGGPRWLGPITPIGGLLFLAGWACMGVAVLRERNR